MIRFFLLLVVAALASVGAIFWVFRVNLVERSLSKTIQSDVKIGDIKVGLNQIQLINVSVEKGLFGTLFSADQIQASFDLISLFSKEIKIEDLRFEHPVLRSEITKHIDKKALDRGSRYFSIDHVKMINLQDASTLKTLPFLEIHAIGSKKPLTASEMTLDIFDRMAHALTHETAWGKMIHLYKPIESGTQDIYSQITENAKNGLDWIKSKIESSSKALNFFDKKETAP